MIDPFLLNLQSWHFLYKAAARILYQLIQYSIALREKAFDVFSFVETASQSRVLALL